MVVDRKLHSFEYHLLLELDPDERSASSPVVEFDPLTRRAQRSEMAFFDNLRVWSKEKRYRYLLLLALSLSGDGWSVFSFARLDTEIC